MKKNIPRVLAWLLLVAGLAGGPLAARLERPVSPDVLRWLVTAGAAMMILSFFWFPRRVGGRATERSTPVSKARRTAVRRKTTAKPRTVPPAKTAPPAGRRVRKLPRAVERKRSQR